MSRSRLTLTLFLTLTVAASTGCRRSAMGVAGPSEPALTNPVRLDAWLGDDPFPDEELGRAERKYDGGFRLPLSDDWTFDLPDEGRWALTRMELGAPAVRGDLLLVGSSRASGLFVLDRADGRLLRVVPTSGPVQAAPRALDDDGWLVADTFGQLQRPDADLEPVWDTPYEAGGAIYRSPVLDGDRILVSTARDQVAAISLETGAWIWSYRRDVARTSMELAILGSPAPTVGDGIVYAGFSDGILVGLDPASGRLKWEARVGDGQFPDVEAEPILSDGVLVAAAFDGPVVGLDPATRRVLWTVEDSGAVSSMEEASGSILTSDAKGRVRSIVAATGAVEWTWEKKGRLFGPPRRAGGFVLVADVDGTLYALDRYEGALQWVWRPSDGTRIAGIASAITVDGRQVLFPTAGGMLVSLIAESGLMSDRSEEPGWRADRPIGW